VNVLSDHDPLEKDPVSSFHLTKPYHYAPAGKRPGHKLDNRSIDVGRLLRMHTESTRSKLINLVTVYKQKKEVRRLIYQYQRQ
jgi:hypothetical protein